MRVMGHGHHRADSVLGKPNDLIDIGSSERVSLRL
jgi:hypothetical protein